jgi:beta-lactamase superfamily II metal-dependent hydrolase
MTLQVFKAGNGDAILIQFTDRLGVRRNILVDGGNHRPAFSENLSDYLLKNIVSTESIDLLVVTHLDQDHIKGALYLLETMNDGGSELRSLQIRQVWFNSRKTVSLEKPTYDISSGDMLKLENALGNLNGSTWYKRITCGFEVNLYGARITVLSPDIGILENYTDKYVNIDLDVAGHESDHALGLRELFEKEKKYAESGDEYLDSKLENAVSIAFLLEDNGKSVLMLGDAIPAVIDLAIDQLLNSRGLTHLDVDVIKLSHHGSRKSLSMKFLQKVRCQNYIISTNGKKSNLPNKSTIAKILLHSKRHPSQMINLFFNYLEVVQSLNFSTGEYREHNFSCIPPSHSYGSSISL